MKKFISGLPDMNPLTRGQRAQRSVDDALHDLKMAMKAKRRRRRDARYNVAATPATNRIAKRIVGERDD